MTSPPPGWYTNPDNPDSVRWWDGKKWTAAQHNIVKTPEAQKPVAPQWQKIRKPKNGDATTAVVVGIISLIFYLGVGFLGVVGVIFGIVGITKASTHRKNHFKRIGAVRAWVGLILSVAAIVAFLAASTSSTSTSSHRSSSEVSDVQKSEPETPQLTPAEAFDENMEKQGFQTVRSGETYFRWYTEEEMAQSSCGYTSCTYGVIYSKNGCASGFYVKADLLSGGTPVGWTNETTASAQAGETLSFQLRDHQEIADSYRIAELHCMS